MGRRAKNKSISYKEATRFKNEFVFPVTTAVSTMASFNSRLKFETEKNKSQYTSVWR